MNKEPSQPQLSDAAGPLHAAGHEQCPSGPLLSPNTNRLPRRDLVAVTASPAPHDLGLTD
ncbi:hypothetical protein E2C01_052807 [Portunus trituberculatus]|uniref:Uncharacterized protein n=1 Tax=Portunus trituberculatus TaxID=210409 RepID=A0A5B7GP74_PORTR|nr:hypothetical protein [Portunus trituberculatus]